MAQASVRWMPQKCLGPASRLMPEGIFLYTAVSDWVIFGIPLGLFYLTYITIVNCS